VMINPTPPAARFRYNSISEGNGVPSSEAIRSAVAERINRFGMERELILYGVNNSVMMCPGYEMIPNGYWVDMSALAQS
jgi:hypothetical protein